MIHNPMTGKVLGLGSPGQWNDARVSCPVVIRDDGDFWMWNYGREEALPGIDGLPIGRTGLHRSDDGIHWQPVDGPGPGGSVLDPNPVSGRFDSFLVGGSDVVPRDGEYWLYYVGARETSIEMDGRPRKGFPIAIGLARSTDRLRYTRVDGPFDGAILPAGDPDAWDGYCALCPRVMFVDGFWRMTYNGRGPHDPNSVGLAESADGIVWEKRGRIFAPNPDPAAFDSGAVSSRHIIRWQGGYLMAYEGQPASGPPFFRLGLATSADGLRWERLPGTGTGGCILDLGEPGAWDEHALGTPWLLPMPDGSLQLYYVGLSRNTGSGIGLAVCDGNNLQIWSRHAESA